jgi:isocitrate dehydrogenase
MPAWSRWTGSARHCREKPWPPLIIPGWPFKGPLATSVGGQGVNNRFEDGDIVIVRENTDGLYAGLEHYLTPRKDSAESLAALTRTGSQRVIEYAFK